jgi:3-dehydroquinate synthase
MKTIRVDLENNAYPVYLGDGLLGASQIWGGHLAAGRILVVSNEVVAPLYLDTLTSALPGRDVAVHILPDGEPVKTVDTWYGIIDRLVGMQARRDSNIIALGGGVVGDIAGFAAATYMRGIQFIQAPTTLLAQVDASVGGKTAINHDKGKNLVGAFHQPDAVLIDTTTLNTLPHREFNAGMAEVIKYGAIRDNAFFDWLEQSAAKVISRDGQILNRLIYQSVSNKAAIVAADEKETGIRALLNFGHSFGHAIETVTEYSEFLHGEAVSIGMVIAARLSELRGLCEPGTADRLAALLKQFDLPTEIPDGLPAEQLLEALEIDKKAVASGLRLILLNSLGHAVIDKHSKKSDIVSVMNQSTK